MATDTETIERVLLAKKEELAAELAVLTAVPRDPMAAVSFGKRIGDGTTEAVDRLNKVGVAEKLSEVAEQVDRALEALTEGAYGTCEVCGAEIPAERLEAIPWSTLCVGCAAER
ncbi:MAG: TraR/DksA C4-type zinc finger protein [Actinomycetota bacterium]